MDISYLDFSPRLKEIMSTQTSINSEGEVIKVGVISTLNNLRIIREIIRKLKFSKTLEIGLAYGTSALTILATLTEMSLSSELGQVSFSHTAIDPFQTRDWNRSSIRVIEEEGYSENFRFFEDYSAIVLASFLQKGEKFDFIYIDGSHLFENVFVDFYYTSFLLNEGGIVLFDDCTDKHISKVIKFVRKNYFNSFENLDLKPFENPKKPLRKRVGNLLGIRQLNGFIKIADPPRDWNAKFHNF